MLASETQVFQNQYCSYWVIIVLAWEDGQCDICSGADEWYGALWKTIIENRIILMQLTDTKERL